MADWQTETSEVVYETPWIRVRKDKVITQNDERLTYSYVELQNPTVFVIVVDKQRQIFLQSVYRYLIRQRAWEVPAGYIDAGEATDDEADITDRQFKSLQEIESMIVHGTLVDSPVIAALYRAKLHGI